VSEVAGPPPPEIAEAETAIDIGPLADDEQRRAAVFRQPLDVPEQITIDAGAQLDAALGRAPLQVRGGERREMERLEAARERDPYRRVREPPRVAHDLERFGNRHDVRS